MSHQEAVTSLNSFKATQWTDEKGVKMSSAQIASQYGKLADRERMLRKQAEQEKTNQEKDLEIARLKQQLEGKSKKSA